MMLYKVVTNIMRLMKSQMSMNMEILFIVVLRKEVKRIVKQQKMKGLDKIEIAKVSVISRLEIKLNRAKSK